MGKVITVMECRHQPTVDLDIAADEVHLKDLNGLSRSQIYGSVDDSGFKASMVSQGCGAMWMADNIGHRSRLYASLCHRYYTRVGMQETISAQERHAKWVQGEANRRLQEHGSLMKDEGEAIGRMGGYQSGHQAGIEAGKNLQKRPLFDFGGDFAGGFVDAFKWIGVVGVALILAVVYMAYGKGKG